MVLLREVPHAKPPCHADHVMQIVLPLGCHTTGDRAVPQLLEAAVVRGWCSSDSAGPRM